MLVIDQSSKSTYAYVFLDGKLEAKTQRRHKIVDSAPGQFEFDPEEIYVNALLCMSDLARALISRGISPHKISECAMSLQRESLVVFNRDLDISHCGISWGDTRCSEAIKDLSGIEYELKSKTGLLLGPNLTGMKYLHWQRSSGFKPSETTVVGTLDTFLLFKMLGILVQEVSMASRTGYFSLEKNAYDATLLHAFGINERAVEALTVMPSRSAFGRLQTGPFKGAQLVFVVGDTNAAFLGSEKPGVSIAMGYGAFLISEHTLLQGFKTLIAHDKSLIWGYETSLHAASGVLDWLVQVGVIPHLDGINDYLGKCETSNGVLISSFLGVITGITLSVEAHHLVRAALEGIAADLCFLLQKSEGIVRISGGISRNDAFCEILADVCQRTIIRVPEMTARGCYKHLHGSLSDDCEVCSQFAPNGKSYIALLTRWQSIYSIKFGPQK